MKKIFIWGVGLSVFCLLIFQFGISAQDTNMEEMCNPILDMQVEIARMQYKICDNFCDKSYPRNFDQRETCCKSCIKQYEKAVQDAENVYERCLESWGGDPAEPGWDTTPNE